MCENKSSLDGKELWDAVVDDVPVLARILGRAAPHIITGYYYRLEEYS